MNQIYRNQQYSQAESPKSKHIHTNLYLLRFFFCFSGGIFAVIILLEVIEEKKESKSHKLFRVGHPRDNLQRSGSVPSSVRDHTQWQDLLKNALGSKIKFTKLSLDGSQNLWSYQWRRKCTFQILLSILFQKLLYQLLTANAVVVFVFWVKCEELKKTERNLMLSIRPT